MGLISNSTTIFGAGAMAAGTGGSMVFIKKLTASSSANIDFVNGTSDVVLDNTYKEYLFTFKDIHPAVAGSIFRVNFSDDTSSHSYDLTKTTSMFRTRLDEDDSGLLTGIQIILNNFKSKASDKNENIN